MWASTIVVPKRVGQTVETKAVNLGPDKNHFAVLEEGIIFVIHKPALRRLHLSEQIWSRSDGPRWQLFKNSLDTLGTR